LKSQNNSLIPNYSSLLGKNDVFIPFIIKLIDKDYNFTTLKGGIPKNLIINRVGSS